MRRCASCVMWGTRSCFQVCQMSTAVAVTAKNASICKKWILESCRLMKCLTTPWRDMTWAFRSNQSFLKNWHWCCCRKSFHWNAVRESRKNYNLWMCSEVAWRVQPRPLVFWRQNILICSSCSQLWQQRAWSQPGLVWNSMWNSNMPDKLDTGLPIMMLSWYWLMSAVSQYMRLNLSPLMSLFHF